MGSSYRRSAPRHRFHHLIIVLGAPEDFPISRRLDRPAGYGAPSGGLIDIPISFFPKNKLHLKAHEVAEFRLVAAIPLYRRAPSKSVRAEGLREHHSRSQVKLAVAEVVGAVGRLPG